MTESSADKPKQDIKKEGMDFSRSEGASSIGGGMGGANLGADVGEKKGKFEAGEAERALAGQGLKKEEWNIGEGGMRKEDMLGKAYKGGGAADKPF